MVNGQAYAKRGARKVLLTLEYVSIRSSQTTLYEPLECSPAILRHGDDIGGEARLDRAAFAIHTQQSLPR